MTVRMTWKGQLNLGLVSIPVGMATAVREKDVKFKQFTEDGHAVGRQEFDKETGEILARSDIKKGYEVDGKIVLITDADLESVALESTKALDVVCTVDSIDPMLYASHQWLVPQEGAEAAYDLLVETLAESGQVALAKTVRRSKQHIVAIHSDGSSLIASFLHYADEVVTAPYKAQEAASSLSQHKTLLAKLLADMAQPGAVESFTDEQREKVLALIEAKAAGVEPVISEVTPKDETIDLLAALEASITVKEGK